MGLLDYLVQPIKTTNDVLMVQTVQKGLEMVGLHFCKF